MSRLFKSFVLLLLALFALDCSGHAFGYWKFDGPSTFGLVVWLAITVGAMWASLSQLRSLGTSPVSSHEAGASRPVIGQAEGTPAHEAAAQRPGRSRSYIARHWRGELSLARSYWVNMWLLGIPMGVLAQTISGGGETAFGDAPRSISASILCFLVAYAILGPWQFIGIWRAATRHIATTGRRFWARVAQLVCAGNAVTLTVQAFMLGPLAWHLGHFALGIDTIPPGDIRVIGRGREVEVSGTIGFGTAERLADMLRQHPEARILRLNSRGGRIGEAYKLRDIIGPRGMTTYTSSGCYSACTDVFLAGKERVVHQDARLGFHRPGLPGVWASLWDGEVEADARAMLATGVEPTFVARATATPNADLWKPTNEELLTSHFATRLSDGSEFSFVVDDPRSAHEEIESELLKTRLYRVLKLYEPEVYQAALGIIDRVIADQGTLGDIRRELLANVSEVLGRRLPVASDAALGEFGRHLASALGALERTDTAVCYGYLFPEQSKTSPLLYLSKALIDEESDVIAGVIESAATMPGRRPSEEEMTSAFKQLGYRLGRRLGATRALAVFQAIQEPSKNQQRMCGATREMYEDILTLPARDAGLMLRSLAATASPSTPPSSARSAHVAPQDSTADDEYAAAAQAWRLRGGANADGEARGGPSSGPEEALREFYSLIGVRDFEAAWRRFSSRYRLSLHDDHAGWADGFRSMQSLDVLGVNVVTQSVDTATVAFTLVSLDRDEGSEAIKKTFQGTWDMVVTDGVWSLDNLHIRQATPGGSLAARSDDNQEEKSEPQRYSASAVKLSGDQLTCHLACESMGRGPECLNTCDKLYAH